MRCREGWCDGWVELQYVNRKMFGVHGYSKYVEASTKQSNIRSSRNAFIVLIT